MGLKEYHRKRRFERTPEPRGKTEAAAGILRFVVQKHAASRLHYDFRLELDGTLKSWAVPKGPSLDPADRRLAVQVEDHPLDYRTFEGTIPKGNYGAGEVIVWDEGTYKSAHPGGDSSLRDDLAKGRLAIVLDGHKLHGEFALIRLTDRGGKGKPNWLLMKKRDQWAAEGDVTADARSVRSRRSLDDAGRVAKPARAEANGRHSQSFVKPMLAVLADAPFDRAGWLFEVKWDGYRAIAEVGRRTVRLYSRNEVTFADTFPTVVDSLRKLEHTAVLDGEVVVLDDSGRARFQLLQNYRKTGAGRPVYYVFDVLELDDSDLRSEPLHERRKKLASILHGLPGVAISEAVEETGVEFFRAAVELGLEGIVAKDAASPYREGRRSGEWLKVKTHNRQEAVIGGFTAPRGSRKHLGALVLGVFDGPDLVYIGHTGGGSGEKNLADLRARLDPLVQKECPFSKTPKVNAPVRWVEPKLVGEVRFQEWTDDGRMRHPIFIGLREDKPPRSVRRELPRQVEAGEIPAVAANEPKLTNLDKVYWPDERYTKGDLVAYYRDIAPAILPYLRDRPLSLHRHPNGIAAASFFQKDVSKSPPPEWVHTVEVRSESKGEPGRYVVCQDAATLLYVANLGCIEMNPWNSRADSREWPDYLVIDLDPVETPFSAVIEAAVEVRKVLEKAGTEGVCKTSGKRGLHVFVPLAAKYTHDEARQFAELVATIVHNRLPATTSLLRSPSQRRGRVYLDFLQNRRGQTLAAAYSVRPAPGATVSTPLAWREVRKTLDPSKYTILNTRRRLDRVGDLWAPVLEPGIDLAACANRLESLLKS